MRPWPCVARTVQLILGSLHIEGIYGSMRRTTAAKVRLSAFAELTFAAFCESHNSVIGMMDHSVCLEHGAYEVGDSPAV